MRSVLPAGSVARTWKLCPPAVSPAYDLGEVQAATGAPSSEHWKLAPVSLEENAKLALVPLVSAGGPELIVVYGALVSIVQL